MLQICLKKNNKNKTALRDEMGEIPSSLASLEFN